MERIRVATAVAESLFATETAVEAALARAANLMRLMMDTRRTLGLSPTAGNAALSRVAATIDALGGARGEIVQAHGELEKLGRTLNLDTLGFGPLVKPAEGQMRRLSVD